MTDNLPSTVSGGGEIATLQNEMRTPGSSYWTDPGKQVRYRELVESRDAGHSAPAAPSRDSAELTALKAEMKDVRSTYWHGPEALAKQKRYRDLISSQEANTERRNAPIPAKPAADNKPAAVSTRHPSLVALSAAESVERLASEPHGRELVASWGKESQKNAGYAIRQSFRIMDSLSYNGALSMAAAVDSLDARDNAALMQWFADSGRSLETM